MGDTKISQKAPKQIRLFDENTDVDADKFIIGCLIPINGPDAPSSISSIIEAEKFSELFNKCSEQIGWAGKRKLCITHHNR